MNDINRTTAKQFEALAPYEIIRSGRLYQRMAALYADDTNTVRFDYIGCRRPGVRFHDKLCVAVSYDGGSDTYNIVMTTWDGETEEIEAVHVGEGYHGEDFANVGRWAA